MEKTFDIRDREDLLDLLNEHIRKEKAVEVKVERHKEIVVIALERKKVYPK